MKHNPIRPRNPLVAATMFRKAGAHGRSEKALRRAAKMELQREAGVVAAHRTFNPGQDGIESLASHQATNEWRLFSFAIQSPAVCCSGVVQR